MHSSLRSLAPAWERCRNLAATVSYEIPRNSFHLLLIVEIDVA
jgi:hypothetical protein